MFRRASTGEAILDNTARMPDGRMPDADRPPFLRYSYPTYWHYDVLRGLDYLRSAEVVPDERVAEAVGIVESKRDPAGRWPLENPHEGTLHFEMDEGEGKPSRWITLRALRVLRWASPP